MLSKCQRLLLDTLVVTRGLDPKSCQKFPSWSEVIWIYSHIHRGNLWIVSWKWKVLYHAEFGWARFGNQPNWRGAERANDAFQNFGSKGSRVSAYCLFILYVAGYEFRIDSGWGMIVKHDCVLRWMFNAHVEAFVKPSDNMLPFVINIKRK